MKQFHILSCDGGGVRGVFAAELLAMLEHKKPFLSHVDMFCGTSTGALIALSLAAGVSPAQLVQLYQHLAPVLFPKDAKRGADRAKYDSSCFKPMMLEHVFPHNPSLAALPKKVAALAFKLSRDGSWTPHVFHNFCSKVGNETSLIDAALASSAAPLYFPSYQGYVDGGVFATNPSMSALCLALEYMPEMKLENIRLLSLGCGKLPEHIQGDVDWGPSQWMPLQRQNTSLCEFPIFSLFTEAGLQAVDSQCKALLRENYFRLNQALNRCIDLDAVDQIPYLLSEAEEFPRKHRDLWESLLAWVDRNFGT